MSDEDKLIEIIAKSTQVYESESADSKTVVDLSMIPHDQIVRGSYDDVLAYVSNPSAESDYAEEMDTALDNAVSYLRNSDQDVTYVLIKVSKNA